MVETSTTKAKVTLYWLEQSRSQRIVWLLEECKGIDYTIKTHKRGKDMLAPKELKDVHPLGKSPVIKVESPTSEPLVLAESGAIVEYLCDHFATHLVPKRYKDGKDGEVGGETEQWLRYRFYMHYAEGSLMTMLIIALIMDQIKTAPVWFFIKPITQGIASRVENMFLTKNFKTNFGFLESQIQSSPDDGAYLCGKDITAADILMSFPLIAGKGKIDRNAYPKLAGYTKMLEENEVYQRSIKKAEEASGEPYKAML
ncbi:bifunctional glutathione transferase/peroxidase [Vermiconidia calcicola]|uniref:Bifunctional glutathione transferase/peroxidase n=1 Tax=Vermiconidia calcicola TaxID=1690605 RepID=A0ACC3MIJ0_9PEZI|nr:bifunctional glutathione transferase/peroxidase [Vermiconidia calcicola]